MHSHMGQGSVKMIDTGQERVKWEWLVKQIQEAGILEGLGQFKNIRT